MTEDNHSSYSCLCPVHRDRRGFLQKAGLLALAMSAASLLALAPKAASAAAAGRPRLMPTTGNYIIRGAVVLTMDPAVPDLASGDVHVRDGKIAAIGARIDAPGAEIIEAGNMIVAPGFIETHWHLWNSTLKNMLRPGVEYFPLKAAFVQHFKPTDHYVANRLALTEAMNAGMTTVHNFCHNARSPAHVDAELNALVESGLNARYSYGWIDPIPDTKIMPADDVRRVQREWFSSTATFPAHVDLGVAVRGPMYTKQDVYEPEIRTARAMGLPIVMHIGQTKRRYSSSAEMLKLGLIEKQDILVHGQTQSDADLEAIKKSGASVSLSMESELRGQEDGDVRTAILKCMALKINLCSSMDSSVFGVVSMFDNMRMVFNLAVPWRGTSTEKMPMVTQREVLEMVTINGARAMGIDAITGSLTPGKQADFILVRADDLNMLPMGVPTTTVVHSATVANVDTVAVRGNFMKFGGTLLHADVPTLKAQADRSLTDLRQRAGGKWLS